MRHLADGVTVTVQAGGSELRQGVQVAEVLHRAMEQLAGVQALVGQRQPVLEAIDALDATQQEIQWMRSWKLEKSRFSVSPHNTAWLSACRHGPLINMNLAVQCSK